jgi:hypothetical protein
MTASMILHVTNPVTPGSEWYPYAAEIDAEVQLWIACEPGDLPVKTLALVENTSKLPKRIVGLYKLSSVAPQLESAWFHQPLNR